MQKWLDLSKKANKQHSDSLWRSNRRWCCNTRLVEDLMNPNTHNEQQPVSPTKRGQQARDWANGRNPRYPLTPQPGGHELGGPWRSTCSWGALLLSWPVKSLFTRLTWEMWCARISNKPQILLFITASLIKTIFHLFQAMYKFYHGNRIWKCKKWSCSSIFFFF